MRFRGEYFFLSNFYPVQVYGEGRFWLTAEHYYQSEKTEKEEEKLWVGDAFSPGEAKKRGKRIMVRKDWDSVRLDVMKKVVLAKFSQNRLLRDRLLKTGDTELVEENSWRDTFWGVCNGVGENHLGKILMEVRRELR